MIWQTGMQIKRKKHGEKITTNKPTMDQNQTKTTTTARKNLQKFLAVIQQKKRYLGQRNPLSGDDLLNRHEELSLDANPHVKFRHGFMYLVANSGTGEHKIDGQTVSLNIMLKAIEEDM